MSRTPTEPAVRAERDASLLTRAQEVELALRIRRGHRRRLRAAIRAPRALRAIQLAATRVAGGRCDPWEVLVDFEGSHPDADAIEARRQLASAARELRGLLRELGALRRADSNNLSAPRLAAVRRRMFELLSGFDFNDAFLDRLVQPLLARAERLQRARRELGSLETHLGLARGALVNSVPLPDRSLRGVVTGAGLPRTERTALHNRLKNINRAVRSAERDTGLDPQELLSVAQELQLATRESTAARRRLVEANQRLVMGIARRYPHAGLDFHDLVQEGSLGLMRAADRFDPDLGFRFGTYAAWWVRQSIGRLLAEQGGAVRIPPHVQEALHKLNRISRRLVLKSGREPTVEELAAQLGKSPERIKEILSAGLRPVSTDARLGDEDDSATLLDFLPDAHAGPEEEADQRGQRAVLQEAMDALNPREREIIVLRFQDGLTLQEVGEHFGITRERTRQLQEQALRKLRRRLKADLLRRLVRDQQAESADGSRRRSPPRRHSP